MSVDADAIRKKLKNFAFTDLLVQELGWNCFAAQPLVVSVNGSEYVLKPVAEKCGMVVYECQPGADGDVPAYPLRRKIDHQVRKAAHEHLIIFTDAAQSIQIWQWVDRWAGKGSSCREHTFSAGTSGQALVEKLQKIAFDIEEEDRLSITDPTSRTRAAFNVEKVTKRFYDRFKKEHQAFLKLIEGIDERTDRDWYASLMLNRMMFVYFIQKRGFLNGDPDYLRNRLQMIQAHRGKDKFLSFYRSFLLRLFHDGLGKPIRGRAPELASLLGNVPYLNGGLFDVHQLEKAYDGIDIPDEAFAAIFDFFDSYTWHLDERPLRADNEINPDVLGYIFEKFINQKEMGAYYTKEDITGYIGRNTIIPYLFDAARKECPIAFKAGGGVWRLLQDDPDRYIYPAVRSGVIVDAASCDETMTPSQPDIIPESDLPGFVQEGMHDPRKRMFNKQYNLGQAQILDAKGENLALPTETWREYVERRNRCLDLRAKLAAGEVQSIDDLITLNLDIEGFAKDVIENSEGPELVRAFWKALKHVSVLDPTCGSGAFLFAALNILEPLYNACLDGMQGFLDDLERSTRPHSPQKLSDFRDVLAEMAKHPNRRYFVLKSIVLNNLYGVDIMDEAVEICKLRLFLKLVAQVDKVAQIEPLPDIDFNIRAGNTLVGFATYEDVKKAVTSEQAGAQEQGRLLLDDTMDRLEEKARLADQAFQRFHEMQTKHDMDPEAFAKAKVDTRQRLEELRYELDRYLAKEYGVREATSSGTEKKKSTAQRSGAFDRWHSAHKPFHWFIEFYGRMVKNGGFDIIIGNPPYVEYSAVSGEYSLRNFRTLSCGNLYAFVIERGFSCIKTSGRVGMIVQLPIVCTDRMKALRGVCLEQNSSIWFSSFDDRPARLFDGLEHVRATVFVSKQGKSSVEVYSSKYNRWYSEMRVALTECLVYEGVGRLLLSTAIPKIGDSLGDGILKKLMSLELRGGQSDLSAQRVCVFFHNAPQYWIRSMTFAPYFWNQRDGECLSTQIKAISCKSPAEASTIAATMNSSLFYWWFIILSDCRHLNMREVSSFPFAQPDSGGCFCARLEKLTTSLMQDLVRHKARKECQYKTTGKVQYDEFYPRYSKPIIDEIDCVLAEHYGFTDEELDFIINYDIKYRMGRSGGVDGDEEDE